MEKEPQRPTPGTRWGTTQGMGNRCPSGLLNCYEPEIAKRLALLSFFNSSIYYNHPLTTHHCILGTGWRGTKTCPISALVLTWTRAVFEEPHWRSLIHCRPDLDDQMKGSSLMPSGGDTLGALGGRILFMQDVCKLWGPKNCLQSLLPQ